jgi:hypothetical protein
MLSERGIFRNVAGAIKQPGADTVDAIDVVTHIAKEIVETHKRVEIGLAIGDGVFGAGIEADGERLAVSILARG